MITSVRNALLEIMLQQMQLMLNALGMKRSLHRDMESLLYSILTGIEMYSTGSSMRNAVVGTIFGFLARCFVEKQRLALPLWEPTLYLSIPLQESIEGEITVA